MPHRQRKRIEPHRDHAGIIHCDGLVLALLHIDRIEIREFRYCNLRLIDLDDSLIVPGDDLEKDERIAIEIKVIQLDGKNRWPSYYFESKRDYSSGFDVYPVDHIDIRTVGSIGSSNRIGIW